MTERKEWWILKGHCIALVDVLAGICSFSSGAVNCFFFFVAWGGCFLEGSLTKVCLPVQAQHQLLLWLQCTADLCYNVLLIFARYRLSTVRVGNITRTICKIFAGVLRTWIAISMMTPLLREAPLLASSTTTYLKSPFKTRATGWNS